MVFEVGLKGRHQRHEHQQLEVGVFLDGSLQAIEEALDQRVLDAGVAGRGDEELVFDVDEPLAVCDQSFVALVDRRLGLEAS